MTMSAQNFSNLAFLRPLVASMVKQDPLERPTAAQALAIFHGLVKKQSWFARRNRLRRFGETRHQSVVRDVVSFVKEEIISRLWGESLARNTVSSELTSMIESKYTVAAVLAAALIFPRISIHPLSETAVHIRALTRRSIIS